MWNQTIVDNLLMGSVTTFMINYRTRDVFVNTRTVLFIDKQIFFQWQATGKALQNVAVVYNVLVFKITEALNMPKWHFYYYIKRDSILQIHVNDLKTTIQIKIICCPRQVLAIVFDCTRVTSKQGCLSRMLFLLLIFFSFRRGGFRKRHCFFYNVDFFN